MRCHGLGIVDNNELNSYLDYCSHRLEYRIREKEERENHLVDRKSYIQHVCLEEVSPVFVAPDYLTAFVRQ